MKIAIGAGNQGIVKTQEVTWPDIVKKLSKHNFSDKKENGFFVGGAFSSEKRRDEFLECRTLLTLDIDKYQGDYDDFAFDVGISALEGLSYVIYSTWRSVNDAPRMRLVLPLSRAVSGDDYRVLSRAFAESLPFDFDECSFTPNQFMYLPNAPVGGVEPFVMTGEGVAVDVSKYLAVSVVSSDVVAVLNDEDPFADLPLDDVNVQDYLDVYPAESLEYDGWLMVGMALYHQFGGDVDGYQVWLDWSAKSSKHNKSQMSVKYKSFGKGGGKKITFKSIIHAVKNSGVKVLTVFDGLRGQAQKVDNMSDYIALRDKIKKMDNNVLDDACRTSLASELHKSYGISAGFTKADIKKGLKFEAKKTQSDVDAPDWVNGWYFLEKPNLFFNDGKIITQQSFDNSFGRENECKAMDCRASDLALHHYMIPKVYDFMYWPCALTNTFVHEGKEYLNSFVERGELAYDTMTSEGVAAIDIFLEHIRFTVADENEQTILLDWLSHIVQNTGKLIRWALLLQGVQGSGKSYYHALLSRMLGSNVKTIEAAAIGGRFTSWAHGALVNVVEEIRISGENRYAILDRLKPFITNNVVQIEEKGRDHREVPNFTNYLLLTNHKDAIPIDNNDRRYCVLFSQAQSSEQLYELLGGEDGAKAYFKRLFDALEHAGSIKRYLLDRTISAGFIASGRAPDTVSRSRMIDNTANHEGDDIADLIVKYDCPIINDNIVSVTLLQELCKNNGDMLPLTRTISSQLLKLGYQQVAGRRVKINQKHHYIWYKPTLNEADTIAKVKVHQREKDANKDVPF